MKNGSNQLRLGLLAVLLCLAATAAQAQPERFELGRRLRICEAAWDAQPDPQARTRAVPHLKQAVQHFFALKLSAAALELDAARFALSLTGEPSPFTLWAESLYLKPESRLLDKAQPELTLTLEQFYPARGAQPQDTRLRVTLLRGKQPVGRAQEFKPVAVPLTAKLSLKDVPEGDFTLRGELVFGKHVLATGEQTISIVAGLPKRLDRLQQAAEALQGFQTDTETARALAKLLAQLAQRQTLETDYPAARLLAEAEEALRSVGLGRAYYGNRKAGQFWLTLAIANGAVPVRLLAPATVKHGDRLPLVIAMHGAGGSENLFFDGYGRGAIAALCEQRGWLLVAPRGQPDFTPARATEIIDAVDKLYPVERERVFLVGHSMGAAQAIGSVQYAPTRFAAVAALGGGGTVREQAELRDVPFFVGIGTQDFAYPQARKLGFELKKAEVRALRFREYPDIEHLVIVQVALPDVFTFFDDVARAGK